MWPAPTTIRPTSADNRATPSPAGRATSGELRATAGHGFHQGFQRPALRARHPEAHQLARIYAALDIPVTVEEGPPGLHARLETPNGIVSLGPA